MYDDVPSCVPQFTGKKRDSESGLDYFGARFNASNLGRYMTPDWSASPEPVPYANLDDPQTLIGCGAQHMPLD
jgi:RHS repeat-associated protein